MAALLYGFKLHSDVIVAGSPQYEPASYLLGLDKKAGNHYGRSILEEIVDNERGYDKEFVDHLLSDVINQYPYSGKLDFIYSTNEPSWKRDVNRLVAQLEGQCSQLRLHDMKFETHDEIAQFFKRDLCRLLSE